VLTLGGGGGLCSVAWSEARHIYMLLARKQDLFFGKSHQSKILYRPLLKVMIAVQRAIMQPSAN
jgi:hypothetical protein